jgi:hypothetical protein
MLQLPGAYPQSGGALPQLPLTPTTSRTPTTSSASEPASPSDIFGGNSPPILPLKSFGASPKTPMNLLGEVEKWGVSAATNVTNVNINVSQMTGAQLIHLLQKLPDGVTYSLNLEKET